MNMVNVATYKQLEIWKKALGKDADKLTIRELNKGWSAIYKIF